MGGRSRAPLAVADAVVQIDKLPAQTAGEQASDGGLTCAHETHEDARGGHTESVTTCRLFLTPCVVRLGFADD
jgi:hypothetical protein